MLKRKDFYHQRINYSFHWNLRNYEQMMKRATGVIRNYEILGNYLKLVCEGKIPENIFNTRGIPRISRFKVMGLKKVFVNSLSKKLIRSGKIEHYGQDSKFPIYVREVFNNYKMNKIYKTPGHEPILKNILIKDEHSIAIEVPIWRKMRDSYLTGHIDLIQFEDGMVKVIDYKPEGNFLLSLPQVAMYGLLMKSNFNLKEIKCVSFNREEVWEFEPLSSLIELSNYLKYHGISRPWEKYISIKEK
ncbi:MAG: PD-(D/E)XK nuclease family protein [Promethearchaeota archaeon]